MTFSSFYEEDQSGRRWWPDAACITYITLRNFRTERIDDVYKAIKLVPCRLNIQIAL
jgi:hypothetical protein